MRIVICGAGQFGFTIARRLAEEKAEVVVIDKSPELIARLTQDLDVQGLVGQAAHPDVLAQAQAGDAGLLIAATRSDETNMMACQVAHSLFGVPKKIARVHHSGYLNPSWGDLFGRTNLPVDAIISPEVEIAKSIRQQLMFPGTLDVQVLADGRLWLVGIRTTRKTPILGRTFQQLREVFPGIRVMGIWRSGRGVVPCGEDSMQVGDDVYLLCAHTHRDRVLEAFGIEDNLVKHITIAGGGNVGLSLALQLERQEERPHVRIIEKDKQRAEFIAEKLRHSLVLHGSVSDPEFLQDSGFGAQDALVAVSDHDATNIVACLLGRRLGCLQTVALVKRATYVPLRDDLGIDSAVVPHLITISSILPYARPGRIRAIHQPPEGFGEVVEIEAMDNARIVGTPLRKVRNLEGIRIGCLVRKGALIFADGGTVIRGGDLVILFARRGVVRTLNRLFSNNPDYF